MYKINKLQGHMGFPDSSAGKKKKKVRLQCGRPGFDPRVGKINLAKGTDTHSSILAWRIQWTV